MERSVYIVSIVHIDKPVIVTEHSTIVKNVQSANASKPSVSVTYIYGSYSRYPTVVIVKDRGVLHLDNGTIIIILYKRIIVETGVKGDTYVTHTGPDTYINTVINVKIELPVRINRKRYAIFHKNEFVSVIVIDGSNLIFQRRGFVGNCTKEYRCNKKY